jgi:hypothetical protein
MKSCRFCNDTFAPTHGNQQYCSSDCHKSQKADTQQKLYGILKEIRKGFLDNYKLFEQLIPKKDKKTYPLSELNNKGFNHNCFYTAYTDSDKNIWYQVYDYSFSIQKKDQDILITITKK